jgi:prophage DNA circulation protein
MSDWRLTQGSQVYQEALTATKSIEEPAVGFAKPAEEKGTSALIKQNNTIIHLLVKIKEDLEDCKTAIRAIRKQKEPATDITAAVDDLKNSLQKLSLGEPPKQKPKGPFYVFKDPKKIFEEEKNKIRK